MLLKISRYYSREDARILYLFSYFIVSHFIDTKPEMTRPLTTKDDGIGKEAHHCALRLSGPYKRTARYNQISVYNLPASEMIRKMLPGDAFVVRSYYMR